jgi:hypothetical protein
VGGAADARRAANLASLLVSRGMAAPAADRVAPGFDAVMGRCILALYRAARQPVMAELGRDLPAAAHLRGQLPAEVEGVRSTQPPAEPNLVRNQITRIPIRAGWASLLLRSRQLRVSHRHLILRLTSDQVVPGAGFQLT